MNRKMIPTATINTSFKVKAWIGLSALWVLMVTWTLLNSVEVQLALRSRSTLFIQKDYGFASLPTLHKNSTASVSSKAANATSPIPRRKHHLIIHVGPEKTASTSLQTSFYQFDSVKRAFAQDNYIYMGRYTTLRSFQEVLLYCPALMKINLQHPCYARFLKLLHDERWRNKHMILSEEVYSKAIWDVETIQIVQTYFLPRLREHWDVSVVAVYRRFHEWLVSARKQRDAELPERQLWPHEGGEPMDSWKEVMLLRQHQRYGLRSHFLPDALAQFYDLNVSVTILNLHHPKRKITEQFVCDFLPNAKNTCRFCRTRRRRERRANVRSGLEYFFDNIVFAAASRGLFDTKGLHRADVVKNLTSAYERIPDLPLICPSSEELKELFQESMHWEQYYAPSHFDLASLRKSFQELNEANQFCRVDSDCMLEGMSSWSDVLQKLTEPVIVSES